MLAHEGHIKTADLRETANTLGKTYEAVNALLAARDQEISHGNVCFIKESKQAAGAMKGVMRYVSQGKTLDKDGARYPGQSTWFYW